LLLLLPPPPPLLLLLLLLLLCYRNLARHQATLSLTVGPHDLQLADLVVLHVSAEGIEVCAVLRGVQRLEVVSVGPVADCNIKAGEGADFDVLDAPAIVYPACQICTLISTAVAAAAAAASWTTLSLLLLSTCTKLSIRSGRGRAESAARCSYCICQHLLYC
jgi:hypothetical protein